MVRSEHRDSKYPFSFVMYAPEQLRPGLPLIIQLHGGGERGDDLALMDVHGFSHLLNAQEVPDCIIIMPQCPANSFWAARVESVLAFIHLVMDDFSVDADRVYLTGISQGGYGAWYTALAEPELFAAIVPICGGGMACHAHVLKMPIWTFHGAADPVVAVAETDEMVRRLIQWGADVRYSRIEGVGHEVWKRTYDRELLDWLLSKKRSEK